MSTIVKETKRGSSPPAAKTISRLKGGVMTLLEVTVHNIYRMTETLSRSPVIQRFLEPGLKSCSPR